MEIFILIIVVILLFVPPFFVGYYVESRIGGIIMLSVVPVLVALWGVFQYLDARSSPEKEARDWSGMFLALPVLAGFGLAVGLLSWGIGQSRQQSQDWDVPIAATPEQPNE